MKNRDLILLHVGHVGRECLMLEGKRGATIRSVHVGGRCRTAARYMCEMAHGPAPSEYHEAAHSCRGGVAGCLNPVHLRWATPRENMLDKHRDGTMSSAKLTEANAREIKRSTAHPAELAARFGVSRAAVYMVRQGKTWAHIR